MSGPHDTRFEDLYRRYYDRVCTFFIAFGFPREQARDLAQDVFVRVYRSMPDYRAEAEWSYLETTARRVALNEIRTKKATKHNADTISVDDQAVQLEDRGPGPEELAGQSELHRRLQSAILQLSPRLQDVLRLYLAGLSYQDIEMTLGISEDAVKTRLREARVRLRDIFGEAPEGNESP